MFFLILEHFSKITLVSGRSPGHKYQIIVIINLERLFAALLKKIAVD
jgi:hypothetical protein